MKKCAVFIFLGLCFTGLWLFYGSGQGGRDVKPGADVGVKKGVSPGLSTTLKEELPIPGDRAKQEKTSAKNTGLQQRRTVPAVVMPVLDTADLIVEAEKRDRVPGSGGYRFAEAIRVDLNPENSGDWRVLGNGDEQWQLQIQSVGALSLNFGFSQYSMPEGGTLAIYPVGGGESSKRVFTAADNEGHGELWTPLILDEEVIIEVRVPQRTRDQLQLQLASVNHGFRGWQKNIDAGDKIGGGVSGPCNVDAVCTSADMPGAIGAALDFYRDQVRSVGAYTLAGVDTCSGALINNTARNRRPFFLTADHCGVRAGNAASVVVYWDFQNSNCRTPGTAANAGVADGRLDRFNSGSIFRARSENSDFCLLELDDEVRDGVDALFAGWDIRGEESTLTCGIHHPAVAEKRISFEFDRTQTTNQASSEPNSSGRYYRVIDWDVGTTESGSSGSPLFNQNGLIIGQLFGGGASCVNSESDWYGKLSASWQGGGSRATGLREWLDPLGSGVVELAGLNRSHEVRLVGTTAFEEGDSGQVPITLTASLRDMLENPLTLDWVLQSDGAREGSDFIAASGQLVFAPGELSETFVVQLSGDTLVEGDETFFVTFSNPEPEAVGIVQGDTTVTITDDDYREPQITGTLTASTSISAPFLYQIEAEGTPRSYSVSGPPGLRVNPSTGLVSWTPTSVGSFDVGIEAWNPVGSDARTLRITVGGSDTSLLEAIDFTGRAFVQNAGAEPWFTQSAVSNDGVDAARSGNIDDNQSSLFSVTIAGPANISFRWRVSSENQFDVLSFFIDGHFQSNLSGETGWILVTGDLPEGNHILDWVYTKDFSISQGADAGYVDQFVVTPTGGYPVWIDGFPVGGLTDPLDDPDIDGVVNLIEYALGMNPSTGDVERLPPVEFSENGISMRVDKPGNPGVFYQVEISDDLSEDSWTTSGTVVVADTPELLEVRAALPELPRKFMRLRVNLDL